MATGRVIHRLATDRQLDFRYPRQALAAKAQFAFGGELADTQGQIAVAEAAPDDVFIDDIAFPAAAGYLLGATVIARKSVIAV